MRWFLGHWWWDFIPLHLQVVYSGVFGSFRDLHQLGRQALLQAGVGFGRGRRPDHNLFCALGEDEASSGGRGPEWVKGP